jgi:hypothetical protein
MGQEGKTFKSIEALYKSLDAIPKEKRGRKLVWKRSWEALVIQKVLDEDDDIRYRRIELLLGSDLEGTDFFEGCDRESLILV